MAKIPEVTVKIDGTKAYIAEDLFQLVDNITGKIVNIGDTVETVYGDAVIASYEKPSPTWLEGCVNVKYRYYHSLFEFRPFEVGVSMLPVKVDVSELRPEEEKSSITGESLRCKSLLTTFAIIFTVMLLIIMGLMQELENKQSAMDSLRDCPLPSNKEVVHMTKDVVDPSRYECAVSKWSNGQYFILPARNR